MYLVPGLLPTTLAHVAWIGLATRIVRHLVVPALGGLPPPKPAGRDDSTYEGPIDADLTPDVFGLLVFLAWNVLSIVILSPLEVIQVRLAVQRPESQQPLHIAFSGAARRGAPLNPASHQARAAAATMGAYSDAAAGTSKADKPLPSQPPSADAAAAAAEEPSPLPRPSFAIEDEEASDEEGESGGASSKPAVDAKPSASSARPTPAALDAASTPQPRPLPHHQQQQQQTFPLPLSAPPAEPVIALRPCDQPLTASAAQAAQAQGFGAPIVERYTGFVDCLNKLVDEEGAESLYRGAVVTLLGTLIGAFGA